MRLLLLPGMDGTGRLFAPLLAALPPDIDGEPVAYPPDEPLGYEGLLPLVEAAAARGGDFVVVGESFSGPLALLLAARSPPGLRGVVLCATFIRFPLPVPALPRLGAGLDVPLAAAGSRCLGAARATGPRWTGKIAP